jgi:hypothetical protein
MNKVLIVAFDGLDYDLIKEFNLEHICQQEFGSIENKEGIDTIVTTELFASFITGKTWKKHGAVGLGKFQNPWLDSLEKKLNRNKFFRKFSGLRKNIYKNMPLLNGRTTSFTRDDMKIDTIFEKVPNSKAIDVPSYNYGYNVKLMDTIQEQGLEAAEKDLDRFTKWKKWELFDEMEKDHDLIMAHFHKPDHIHHWYWEVGKMDKVKQTYYEMDEFAGEILDKAEKTGFDTVIFMSDHGLPDVENGGHNENAFYSSNRQLFGVETPHITDFHDEVLKIVNGQDIMDIDV